MSRYALIIGLCAMLLTSAVGQTGFRAGYQRSDPAGGSSTFSLEEKVALHQRFLAEAVAADDSLKRLYGLLYLFYDYAALNDYEEAADYLLQAETLAQASGRPGWRGWVIHRRGVLAVRLKTFEEAIPPYEAAAELCGQAGDSLCVGENLEQLSAMYKQLDDFATAQRYFELAYPLIEKYGSPVQLAATLNNYGTLLSHQDRAGEAIPYLQRSIAINHEQARYKEEAQAMNNLADAYRRQGRYDLALRTYDDCIRLNTERGMPENMITNYMGLYVLYVEREDFRRANEFLIKHIDLRDSLIGADTQRKIADMENKYAVQQKELELQKSEAALDKARRSLERGGAVLIFLLLLSTFGLWRWRIQTRATEHELARNRQNLGELTRILVEKNSLLADLETRLAEQSQVEDSSAASEEMEETLYNQRVLTDGDWATFKAQFEKSYPGYLLRLRAAFPSLSEAEERLFIFIKLNLTSKEIAAILGISNGSVKKTRYRLRKRLDLDENTDLDSYIGDF